MCAGAGKVRLYVLSGLSGKNLASEVRTGAHRRWAGVEVRADRRRAYARGDVRRSARPSCAKRRAGGQWAGRARGARADWARAAPLRARRACGVSAARRVCERPGPGVPNCFTGTVPVARAEARRKRQSPVSAQFSNLGNLPETAARERFGGAANPARNTRKREN